MEGVFAINKPKGITSQRAVAIIKRAVDGQKVGHAGTLDPLASGVLVVGVGRAATKQLGDITLHTDKEYLAEVTLGATSTTDDDEGQKIITPDATPPDRDRIEQVIRAFLGEIKQRPPVYSAIKVGGKPAYKRTRAGQQLDLGERKVRIDSIEIVSYRWPLLTIRCVTGAGTYIRSLARDIGEQLGVGGYLSGLERTRVGTFTLAQARELKEFEKKA